MMKIFAKIILISTLLTFPMTLFAQGIPLGGGIGGPSVSLSLSPENPVAYGTVRANIKSFSTDLNQSVVSWYLNGNLSESDQGQTSFSFKVGSVGERTQLDVVVRSSAGEFRTSRSIMPAEVDLIWEADTYTPQWYYGKPLYNEGASLKFTAIPNIVTPSGRKVSPSETIYTWKQGTRVLGSRSGYGRDTLRIQTGPIDERVSISVTAEAGGVKAQGAALVEAVEEELIIYENDPLMGVRNERSVLESFEIIEDEVSFTSFPFFFRSFSPTDASLSYSWRLGNESVPESGNQITFKSAGESGAANVSLRVESTVSFLQGATDSFNLIFGEE